jgi:hypothetical protein
MTSVDKALRWCASAANEWLSSSSWLDDMHIKDDVRNRLRSYVSDLIGMLRFMATVGSGPDGSHSAFLRHGIDSVTLLVGQDTQTSLNFLRSTEKIVRSLSNTEEKLHASYWLYLMPNHSKFVSIEEYYFAMVLVMLPMFLEAMRLVYCASSFRLAFALISLLVAEGCGLLVYGFARATYHYQLGTVLLGLLKGGDQSLGAWHGLTAPLLAAFTWLILAAIWIVCAVRLVCALNQHPLLQPPSEGDGEGGGRTHSQANSAGGKGCAKHDTSDDTSDDPGWCSMKACYLMLLV